MNSITNNSTNQFQTIFNLFKTAKSNGLKYPKIYLEIPGKTQQLPIVLSQAGSKSKYPGSISICTPGCYGNNSFYGRIATNGILHWNEFIMNDLLKENLQSYLCELNSNPAVGDLGFTINNCKILCPIN